PLASGRYTITHQLGSLIDHYYFVVTEVTGTAVPTFARSSLSVTISVDTPLRYVVQAVGNPPPHYSLLHGPAGMTIDAESGELGWTPTTADVGSVAVTVRATNRLGSADLTVAFIVTSGDEGSHTLFLPIVEGG
ncbi:MAG: putative Ig domain-containing protein, partial [Caldilineaceae bacterium]|nr:putative Ig domain-containing protein [Caldilineaceae bacterium]